MTERKKEILCITALLIILLAFFSRILFTDMIIRAPDIINEFYWGIKGYRLSNLLDQLKVHLSAAWVIYENSGFTREGGGQGGHFLFLQDLIFCFFPHPSSVAWFIVLNFFSAATGTYLYCRLIGVSRFASLVGGLIFVLAPEYASLINAGHVMKIATIAYAPWAFYFFEKGFRTNRIIFFLATAFVLAYQFFQSHWQIAFYTCLCIAVYGVARSIGILVTEISDWKRQVPKLFGLNMVLMFFFLSTVSIDLLPLYSWSKVTNRGVESGSNQGKGGLNREEAMLWSFPPEETLSFIVPGFFGLSRQEAGPNPTNIKSYYWGRMLMSQTVSYMGVLPWLLFPLPILFRRDRYTWLAVAAVAGGVIFSMGKYTFIYRFLFDYFPGIDRFRVPKMMMFIVPLGLAVMSARGLDILRDQDIRRTKSFKWYVVGICLLPLILLMVFLSENIWKSQWMHLLGDMIRRPNRFERGAELIAQRWDNLLAETGVATLVVSLHAAVFLAFFKKWIQIRIVPIILLALFMSDVWRINDKFMFLVEMPLQHLDSIKKEPDSAVSEIKDPAIEYLSAISNQYRMIPMDGNDPSIYSSKGIPVLFNPNAVQNQRWQNFLNQFDINSSMVDIMNVKHLLYTKGDYENRKLSLSKKYELVFNRSDHGNVILENKNVLPKGWLVPSTFSLADERQILGALRDNRFDPRKYAIVEETPPIEMMPINKAAVIRDGEVNVEKYEGEEIRMKVKTPQNALLVLGEKYYKGWKAKIDGEPAKIYRVDYLLRGVYLTPGTHNVAFVFDPLPYKIGKTLTLSSFAIFLLMLGRELMLSKRREIEVVSQSSKKMKS